MSSINSTDYGQFISTSKVLSDDIESILVPTHRLLIREAIRDAAEAVQNGLTVDLGSIKYFTEHEGLHGAGYTFTAKKAEA